MSQNVLYIALGKINLLEPGRPARLIESKFGQSLIHRASEIKQRNAWKTRGTGAQFMSGRMLWGGGTDDSTAIPVAVTGISYGPERGEVLYSMATDEITGVFALRNKATDEQRLFHTADFRISQLCAHPAEDRIACVVQGKGYSNIGVMRGDGCELAEVTQGDAVDRAPSWVPGSANEIVFQSSGIARDQHGADAGFSPARIERLNIESGEIATMLGDEQHDYLDPRMDAAGILFCVRKPSSSLQRKFNPFRALLDLVLLPFRILFAFFQFINFFSVRYTGNTLVTAGDARQKQADMRKMVMLGNLMQAQRDAEKAADRDREGLVSKKWELVRKSGDAEPQVVHRGVLSFDLCADGSIVFTDGARIFRLQPDGSKEMLGKDQFISQVLALPVDLQAGSTAPEPTRG